MEACINLEGICFCLAQLHSFKGDKLVATMKGLCAWRIEKLL